MNNVCVEDCITKIMQAKKLEIDKLLELLVSLISRIESLEEKLKCSLEIAIDDELLKKIEDKVSESLISNHLVRQDQKINRSSSSLEKLRKLIVETLGEQCE